MKHFCYLGCSILTAEVISQLPECDSVVDLRFVPAGLHEQPGVLNHILQQEIERIEEWERLKQKSATNPNTLDAILLGFGLCEKATIGLHSQSIPLVIPRAHDCITMLLGSKERYQECFIQKPGNYWFSSGWIDRMLPPGPEREAFLQQTYQRQYGTDNMEFLMETERQWQKNYRQGTYINWNLPKSDQYRHYTRKCAVHLGWQYDEVLGDSRLLRDFLNGDWDEERFLTVSPGAEIAPSFDLGIIVSKPHKIL